MKIVILEPLGISQTDLEAHISSLEKLNCEIVYYDKRTEDVNELIERCQDAEAVLLTNLPFPKAVIEKCPTLKFISIAFTGFDHVDMAYCRENNIVVSNAAGYSTNSVAEMAVGMLLDLYRKIVLNDAKTRNLKGRDGFLGTEIFGKKVGIIGTGAIGLHFAKIMQAFGCEIFAFSRSRKQEALDLGLKYLGLDELLSSCDIISLHIPLNDSTKNLLSREKLEFINPEAVLINTARGAVIDNQALADLLNQNRIAGAATDIYEYEPPLKAEHPLLSAKNCLLLPHIAYATKEALQKRVEISFENISKWMDGNPQNVC